MKMVDTPIKTIFAPVTTTFTKITQPLASTLVNVFKKKDTKTTTQPTPIMVAPSGMQTTTQKIQTELQKSMAAYDPTKATLVPGAGPGGLTGSYTGLPGPTIKETPAIELMRRTPSIKVTMPRVETHKAAIPVVTGLQAPQAGQTTQQFIESLPKAEITTQFQFKPAPTLIVPGYTVTDKKGKETAYMGYLPPTPRTSWETIAPEGMWGKPADERSFATKVAWTATHPGVMTQYGGDINKAIWNWIYPGQTVMGEKSQALGSKTPEFVQRGKEGTAWSSLIGGYKVIGAPITAAFKKGKYSENIAKDVSAGAGQLWKGLPGVAQVRNAQLVGEMRRTDYENREAARLALKDSQNAIIDMVKYQTQHPELEAGTIQKIEAHNMAVNTQNTIIQSYQTDQAAYTKDLNDYENTLKDLAKQGLATYDERTKTYAISDAGALASLLFIEKGLDTRGAELNKRFNQIVATNKGLDATRTTLEGEGSKYNIAATELNKLTGRVNYTLSKFGEKQQELASPYDIIMGPESTLTTPEKVRAQVGISAGKIGEFGAKTAILAELGVFGGASNVLAKAGVGLPTSGPVLTWGSRGMLAGFGTLTVVPSMKEYGQKWKQMYPDQPGKAWIGRGIGLVEGLGKFGIGTDIATKGQVSLLKGYQVRDVEGRLVGGGLNIRDPLSPKLTATKPIFSYGEVGTPGAGVWGAKIFGYARPNIAALELPATKFLGSTPAALRATTGGVAAYTPKTGLYEAMIPWQGKEQSAFLLANLQRTAPESAAFIRAGTQLGEQAFASGLKTTGKQYVMDFNKLQNIKGLSPEEIRLLKQINNEIIGQMSGGKSWISAATSSGPKQFMGSSVDDAKGLLSLNKVRAGKIGDIDIDFYGNAIGAGQNYAARLNALGKHQWVFDETMGKVMWKPSAGQIATYGRDPITVYNVLGPDIEGAYLKYTPFGSFQKPSEMIGYRQGARTVMVPTKSTSASFYDKLETGMGAYFESGGTAKLVVAPTKIKSVGDLNSMVKVLSSRGFIARPDANAFTQIMEGKSVGITISKPIVEMPTPIPFPIVSGTEAAFTSTSIGTRLPLATSLTAVSPLSTSSVSTPSLLSSLSRASELSSTSAPSSISSASSLVSSVSSASGVSRSSRSSRSESASSASESASSGSGSSTGVGSIGTAGLLSADWPDIGALGGEGEVGSKASLTAITGVNVNYLRNFFFEKVQMEKPVQMRKSTSMLSTSPVSTSIKPVDVTKRLGDVLGKSFYTGIVSNSTPFPKKLPKKVKSKKARL